MDKKGISFISGWVRDFQTLVLLRNRMVLMSGVIYSTFVIVGMIVAHIRIRSMSKRSSLLSNELKESSNEYIKSLASLIVKYLLGSNICYLAIAMFSGVDSTSNLVKNVMSFNLGGLACAAMVYGNRLLTTKIEKPYLGNMSTVVKSTYLGSASVSIILYGYMTIFWSLTASLGLHNAAIAGFGVFGASYLLNTSLMAKTADVVADASTNTELAKLAERADKTYDIMADGTFTKLIVGFGLGLSIFMERMEAPLFPTIITFLLIELISIFKKDFELSHHKVERYFVVSMGLSTLLDIYSNWSGVASIMLAYMVNSMRFLNPWSKTLLSPYGSIGMLPLLMSAIPMIPGIIGVYNPSIGLMNLTTIATMDQMGFVADLLDHTELDILGNQIKGCYKYATMLYLSPLSDDTMGFFRHSYASSLASIMILGMSFYRQVDLIARSSAKKHAKDTFYRVDSSTMLRLVTALIMGFRMDSMMLAPIALSGSINDNVKYIAKTTKGTDAKIVESAVNSDIEGDFKKDVIFPFVVARYMMFPLMYILAVADTMIKQLFIDILGIKG